MSPNEQFEVPKKRDDDIVYIQNKNREVPVSFQILQDIYNEITGKREEIENRYKIQFQLRFEDIEQLHIKINQLYEQYNIKSHNCSVTLFYVKETKEVFSSFERFKLFNQSSLSEVERVYLKYNFLIVLPKTKRTQSYELEINLSSQIAARKSIKENIRPPAKIFQIFLGQTAIVSMKYIDYLVARNFLDTIDEWFRALPTNKSSTLFTKLSERSHYFPVLLKNGFFILASYLLYKKYLYFIPPNTTDLSIFSKYAIVTIPIIYFSLRIGLTFGKYIEDAIDDMQPLSYICLTRGDEKLIAQTKRNNKIKIIKAIGSLLMALLTGIGASIIANLLTKT